MISTPRVEEPHPRPFAPRSPATLAASSALDEARPLDLTSDPDDLDRLL
jgi:hypothetical protein